jgi:uncharacterized membrane protein YeaQ/YmgE (transglycosylase-associated protein family)
MLELIIWTATGWGVGWLVRTAMRSRRDFGLLGDLTTGWLGGVVGGWLFRRLGVVAPDDTVGHVLVALVGATALLIGLRVLRRVTFVARVVVPAEASAQIENLEEHIRGLGQLERRIISGLLTSSPRRATPIRRSRRSPPSANSSRTRSRSSEAAGRSSVCSSSAWPAGWR